MDNKFSSFVAGDIVFLVIAYIDESKSKSYILVLHLMLPRNQTSVRKALAQKLLAGQRSIHFRKESDRRRVLIIRLLLSLDLKVIVFRAAVKNQTLARNILIENVCENLVRFEITELVFELDKMSIDGDNQLLNQMRPRVPWDHRERHQEPLLWVADAVAWCVNRGGEWERMVRPLILETISC